MQVVSVPVLVLIIRQSYDWYFASYWCVIFLSVLITFALIRELFLKAFSYRAPSSIYERPLVYWALVTVAVFAIVVLLSLINRETLADPARAILLIDRVARTTLLALVLLLLMASPILGVRARRMLFGIALGFALFTSVRLIADILISWPGHARSLRLLNSSAYTAACVVWLIWAVWAYDKPPVPRNASGTPSSGSSPDAAPPANLDDIDAMVQRAMQENDPRT